MRDDLPGLLLRQPVIHRPIEVVRDLCDLPGSNQRTDSDRAPVESVLRIFPSGPGAWSFFRRVGCHENVTVVVEN
jgi:hypothetical protein